MMTSVEETQGRLLETPSTSTPSSRWEKPLIVIVLAFAATLMLAWLAFLAWVGSLILFALWP
ncbi:MULTISPECIES: hypothetical protein [unclassified Aureimonas]|uniref:hypothetical protein n=1 Tax=unclassified Aureimonas TaxID=2615206 RepID=UPI0006FF0D7A|nr:MULTISPECIES: hypothetical protein [unclassified Aureimonas]KQT60550.1 hypothetical protein ASG62_07880 [Aureimonas sp. Leaf427]KQT79427.1 hypothetical protein ASG54_10480 [Aureimonas sp. Leaf460]